MQQPIIYVPRRLTPEYITEQANNIIFVYSTALGGPYALGQARVCLGRDNCYGVPVRKTLCKSSGYWNDNITDSVLPFIDAAIDKIPRDDKRPIYVIPNIGCGASRFKEFAPSTWKYVMERLSRIASPRVMREET